MEDNILKEKNETKHEASLTSAWMVQLKYEGVVQAVILYPITA